MRFRGRRTIIGATAIALLASSATALADSLEGDQVTPVGQDGSLDFGVVCANEPASEYLYLAIRKQGGGAQTYADGASVSVSLVEASTGLSAPPVVVNIVMPNDWGAAANGTLSPTIAAQVVLVAPAPGAYAGSITYRSNGPNAQTGADRQFTEEVPVTAQVVDCASPVEAPTVTATVDPAVPDGEDGWYTQGPVTVSFAVAGTDPEVTGCDPVIITEDQAKTPYTCTAVNDAGSDEASVTVGLDSTAPDVAVTGVEDGDQFTLGDDIPEAGCETSDALSGVAQDATASVAGGPVGAITVTCSGGTDVAGNSAADVSITYTVVYDFDGFFRPVDNDGWNNVKAGQAVPLKFSLGGDQGLGVIGSMHLYKASCADAEKGADELGEVTTAGKSTLQYDADADEYTYVWKTDRKFARDCGLLVMQLDDGTVHTLKAAFR